MELNEDLFSTMGEVIARVGGPVLEIGAGSGAHLGLYPPGTHLLMTIDLNEHFHPYLKNNLEAHPHVTLDNYLIGKTKFDNNFLKMLS